MNRLCLISLILCTALFLFFPMEAFSAEEIVVGMSAAFKGPSSGLGIELYKGSRAYFDYVNDKGGVNGRKIRIVAYDDGYNPAPAIKNTIQFIEGDKVFALIDYVGTPTVTRVLPLLKKYSSEHVYLFFPFTGAQPHREPPYDEFVFNLRASYQQELKGLVDNFVRIGRKRIAVFYQADAYGRSGWDGLKRALERYGLDIVEEATYSRGAMFDQRMNEHVGILRAASPDAIISIGSYAACAAFIRDARDAGFDVPIANVSFVGSENLLKLLTQISEKSGRNYTVNLINSQVVPNYNDSSLPAVLLYRQLMDNSRVSPGVTDQDASYVPLKYSFTSLEGFLNARLLVEILKRMDNPGDRGQVKKAVESIRNLDIGIDESVTFGLGVHQGLNKIYYTTVRDNRFVTIKDWQVWRK
ncbi:MAG: ABC transporter substrate-binding protein [Nitrospirae bacterium]|nr:ABC transporter substrate-binding protein [Nitrospirota bacterium]MBF0535059.1 ABC transporter substrate-binding protein [Nitrospirota bacterium]MBF0616567.1 ABC transporter substrate-binding protein [Nitrospirota bacterium]